MTEKMEKNRLHGFIQSLLPNMPILLPIGLQLGRLLLSPYRDMQGLLAAAIYLRTHKYIHTYIHTREQPHTHTDTYVCKHSHMHTLKRTFTDFLVCLPVYII